MAAVVKKRAVDRDTYLEAQGTTNRMLAGIMRAIEMQGKGQSLDVDDVTLFARYIGSGLGPVCAIGKQFLVPKETSMTINIGHAENHTSNLSASVDEDVFMNAVGEASEHIYEFIFDGSVWHDEHNNPVILAAFGITTSGTPVVGDKIVVTEKASNVPFDLVQYNPSEYEYPHDKSTVGDSAMLLAHNIQTIWTLPFCPDQLMYYCKTNPMNPGTYKFTLNKARYGNGSEYDGTYYFTITQTIPRFGGFRIPGIGAWKSAYSTNDVINSYVDTYGPKFSAECTCTEADKSKHIKSLKIEGNVVIQRGDPADAINLGTFTCKNLDYYTEEDTTSGIGGLRNRMEIQAGGDNRYSKSLFHLWGNSTAKASTDVADNLGNWFYYRSVFETTPSDTILKWAGYLHGFGKDFLDCIQSVKVKCTIPAYYSSTNTVEVEWVEAKMFPISQTEIAGSNQNGGITEGAKLDYFNQYNTQADRKKLAGTSYQYWFLRTAHSGHANQVMFVGPSGEIGYNDAGGPYGVVPACIIKKSS